MNDIKGTMQVLNLRFALSPYKARWHDSSGLNEGLRDNLRKCAISTGIASSCAKLKTYPATEKQPRRKACSCSIGKNGIAMQVATAAARFGRDDSMMEIIAETI